MKSDGKIRDLDRAKKDLGHARREASVARCAVCGERVTMEDRCTDGLYLHRVCAFENMMR